MNLEEFKATGRDSDDLLKDTGVEDTTTNVGRVYHNGLWIEKLDDGQFFCVVFNEDILDQNLSVVEEFLYSRTFTDGVCCI